MTKKSDSGDGHHKKISRVNIMFVKDVRKLTEEFEETGNPFSDTSQDFVHS